MQCKAMGITDHILPMGDLFFIVVISKGYVDLFSNAVMTSGEESLAI